MHASWKSPDIDVVVYGEFDNETELNAYKAHYLYQESLGAPVLALA